MTLDEFIHFLNSIANWTSNAKTQPTAHDSLDDSEYEIKLKHNLRELVVILYQLKQIKTKQKCYEATKQISRLYGGINPLDGQDLFEKLIFNYIPISLIYSIIFSICTATYTQLSDQDYTSAETEIKAMIVIIPAILALLPLLATWPDNKFIMHTFDEARFFDFDYKQRKSIEIELNETMEMLNIRYY